MRGKQIKIRMDKLSILNLLGDSLGKTLSIILNQVNPNSYLWYSTKANRQVIINKLDISPATLSRYLIKLNDKRILIKSDSGKGTYILNSSVISF